jgi:hypothetical protein
MATDINNPGRVVTANYSPRFTGLHLKAGADHYTISEYHADDAAAFQAGMLVSINESGLVTVSATGENTIGVATLSRTEALEGVEVDFPVEFNNGGTASLVRNGPIDEDHVRVRDAVDGGGSDIGGFTVSGNTITWPSSNPVPDGTTVYATFRFPLSITDLNLQGQNLYGRYDAIARYDNKVPVIKARGGTRFFTAQYDTSALYTYTGVTSELHAGTAAPENLAGLFTTTNPLPPPGGGAPSVATDEVGKVAQPPRADYPLLGVMFDQVNHV